MVFCCFVLLTCEKMFLFPTFLLLFSQFLAHVSSSYFDKGIPMFAITSNICFFAPVFSFFKIANKTPIATMAIVLFCKLLPASFHYHSQLYKSDTQIHAEDTSMMVVASFSVLFFMCSVFFSHERLIVVLSFTVVLVGVLSQPLVNSDYETFTFVCFCVVIAAVSALTILVEFSKVYVTCKHRLASISICCSIFVTCFLVFVPYVLLSIPAANTAAENSWNWKSHGERLRYDATVGMFHFVTSTTVCVLVFIVEDTSRHLQTHAIEAVCFCVSFLPTTLVLSFDIDWWEKHELFQYFLSLSCIFTFTASVMNGTTL